jgi:hypothetical protein
MRFLMIVLSLLLIQPTFAQISDPGFEVVEYRVSIKTDVLRNRISVWQSMDIGATRDGVSELRFSNNALQLRVEQDCVAPYAIFRREDRIVIRLVKPMRRGEKRTIRCLRFEGTPARGLVMRNGLVYTSYFTCDWMLCDQDRPGDKARLGLSVTSLSTFGAATGPGRLLALVFGRDRRESMWTLPQPYPAYTYGFAAGDLLQSSETIGAVTYDYLAEKTAVADSTALNALFKTTPEMLAYFEDKAGVPFPHATYAQVLVKGSDAQEAVGMAIIGTEMIEPILTNPQEDWVIAHELAHQWWGNWITCADWSEFWLNEGVVVFMTAAWKEHKHGRAAYDREMELARKRLQFAKDAGFDKPLAWKGQYPDLRTRRAVQYSKGALFLDALRTEIGDTAFWAGLKLYTQRHAGGTVVSADFQRAMEAASKRDLSAMFKDWVTGEDLIFPPRQRGGGVRRSAAKTDEGGPYPDTAQLGPLLRLRPHCGAEAKTVAPRRQKDHGLGRCRHNRGQDARHDRLPIMPRIGIVQMRVFVDLHIPNDPGEIVVPILQKRLLLDQVPVHRALNGRRARHDRRAPSPGRQTA